MLLWWFGLTAEVKGNVFKEMLKYNIVYRLNQPGGAKKSFRNIKVLGLTVVSLNGFTGRITITNID